ncbi:MAG: glycosyltransferase family 4 protein [Terrimicrobiaceae bacterium]
MKPRVLFLANDLYTKGGVQHVARMSATTLLSCSDFSTRVISRSKIPIELRGRHCITSNDNNYYFQLLASFYQMLWRPCLVFCDHLYTARFAKRARSKNIALWAHLIEFSPPLNQIHQVSGQFASSIFCNSHFTKSQLKLWHPGWDAKTRAVWLGTPDICVKGKDGINERNLIVMLGRMNSSERYKGHDEVIEAMPAILSKIPGVLLTIIGDGDDKTRLINKASNLGLLSCVKFTGLLSNDILQTYLDKASALIMPSSKEGFGLVYLEALRRGIPAIVLKHTVAEEIFAGCGVYCTNTAPEEIATKTCLALNGQWKMESESIQRYLDNFTLEHFRARFLNNIKYCISNS